MLKRSISNFSVNSLGIGSKMVLPREPWSLWCRVHPLYFLVDRGVNVYSTREYNILLFIDRYLSWVRGLSPLRMRKLFKRVRMTVFGCLLASARAQATNSSDEKNSGRFNTNFHSWNVNSSQSHLRNRYLKRVVRFPDEITYHPTISPYLGAMELELTLNSWKLPWVALRKATRVFLGFLKSRSFITYCPRGCERLTLASIPCILLIHFGEIVTRRA